MGRVRAPHSPGVEMYPHQYASVHAFAERLRKRGLFVERVGEPTANQLAVRTSAAAAAAIVEWKPRPSDGDRPWWYVDGEPVEPVDAPDATNRVAEAVRAGQGGEDDG